MNIKLNKLIAELSEVKSVTVFQVVVMSQMYWCMFCFQQIN